MPSDMHSIDNRRIESIYLCVYILFALLRKGKKINEYTIQIINWTSPKRIYIGGRVLLLRLKSIQTSKRWHEVKYPNCVHLPKVGLYK